MTFEQELRRYIETPTLGKLISITDAARDHVKFNVNTDGEDGEGKGFICSGDKVLPMKRGYLACEKRLCKCSDAGICKGDNINCSSLESPEEDGG